MADTRAAPIVPVEFDDHALAADLAHHPPEARSALERLKREIDRDGGLPVSRLKGCDAEGRDGTRLGCHMNESARPSARPGKVTLAHVVNLGSRLTERDRQIGLDCYEHHVLTTDQLQRLHFSGMRTARARLHALYTQRILDRFRPPWQRGEGSTPHHWILDEAGAHVVSALLGIERAELRWRHSTALALANSAKLSHHVEINEFFARLTQEAAAAGGALTEWYGERATHQLFDGTITPDGYGVLNLPARAPLHILLELDRATEPTIRLHEKATRYASAIPRSVFSHTTPLIIIAVPTPARAQAAIDATSNTGAPITVAVWSKATPRCLLPILTAATTSPSRGSPTPQTGENKL